MDLVLLSERLKADPTSYRDEYMEQLDCLYSLVRLHSPPLKQIMPIIPFVVQHSQLDPEKVFSVLRRTLEVNDSKLRQSVLTGLVILRQKNQISSKELFHLLLLYGADLKPFHSACTEFIDIECYDVLAEWYKKGTENQKCFCYFFFLVFFSSLPKRRTRSGVKYSSGTPCMAEHLSESKQRELERYICEALFATGKLSRLCMAYFMNRMEISFDISRLGDGEEHGKRLFREIREQHFDRKTKILKLQVFIAFKLHFNIRCSVTDIILKMIDLESEDLKELLECLIKSVTKEDAIVVIDAIGDEFMNERSADDVACYGMNVMREIYCRMAGLDVKKASYDDIELYQSGELETGSKQGSEEESVGSFVSEEDGSSECANSASGGGIDIKEQERFLEDLKNAILSHVGKYRGNKSKGIFYAYKSLIRALLKNEVTCRPTDYVKRSKTKEERTALRKKSSEERKRELAKERWLMKKNKRGRSKNRKSRLFMKKKKKNKGQGKAM